jgi:hypothetical protein
VVFPEGRIAPEEHVYSKKIEIVRECSAQTLLEFFRSKEISAMFDNIPQKSRFVA